jgi:pimeloyl-ACP methyl ester carboxylesterase
VVGLCFGLIFGIHSGIMAQPALPEMVKDCRVDGHSSEVRCGYIKRALNPAIPTNTLDIHFVVVPSLARRSVEAPLFFLAGGPGQSAIALSGQLAQLFSRLNQRRDLVFVDQRGTGKSAPLRCPEPSKQLPLSTLLDNQYQLAQLRQCQERFTAAQPSTDLRFFSTTAAMQDLDAVRSALGYERIDLVGASYGTRAALEYQRQFPNRTRRMVLDGVAPPDMILPMTGDPDSRAALQGVFNRCRNDRACANAFPNLARNWETWLTTLPQPYALLNPHSRREEKISLTAATVQSMVRQTLYVPALAAALPYALHEAIQGRITPLLGLSRQIGGGSKAMKIAEAMHFSVICSEDGPLMSAATSTKERESKEPMAQLYQQVCAKWPKSTVDPQFYQVSNLKSGAALVLSGGADPVTPPVHGQRVAQALGPLALHIVVPNVSHGVMSLGCMPDIVFQFLNVKDSANVLKLDAKCAIDIPPPMFYFPAQTKGQMQ